MTDLLKTLIWILLATTAYSRVLQLDNDTRELKGLQFAFQKADILDTSSNTSNSRNLRYPTLNLRPPQLVSLELNGTSLGAHDAKPTCLGPVDNLPYNSCKQALSLWPKNI